jgi:hypothetical protein
MNDKELDAMAEVIGRFLGVVLFNVLLFVGLAAAVQVLWNLAVPDVMGASRLTYGQAACLTAMSMAFSASAAIITTSRR